MTPVGFPVLFPVLPLSMIISHAAASDNFKVCYILDTILIIYAAVLTVLYCSLKIISGRAKKSSIKKDTEEGVYEGLSHHTQDTYESLHLKGKP